VLALLLERVAERACRDTWRNIRDDLRQIKLAQLSGPHGRIWQVTEPGTDARKRLKALEIEAPPAVVDHV
ncbi:MAG: transposase, partial [Acidobacteria bacterium]